MSITCQRVAALTLLSVLMQSAGLFLFLVGFFPVKPALRGTSGVQSYEPGCHSAENEDGENIPADRLRSLYEEKSGIPVQFDRVIFMVIDGLPAEFVLGKGRFPPSEMMVKAMPYTHSLLSNGRAVGYHAKAAPPTVTMPRLKAMTSGAIAGFFDIAFNFNAQALRDDNLLGQLRKAGWQMVMLGDETWLRLFPGFFIRQDGVSSFYVKDTIEVDQNVSRHLEDELAATDWNFLILHYLGLDHVGHTGGRASPLMASKLKEMDNVIEQLHKSLGLNFNSKAHRTLLMVVSDHGMTDGGNHGGSSFEEIDALALFIPIDSGQITDAASGPLYSAFQVDIVPTLALLLGVPIPKNSVGVLLPHLFYSFTDEQRLRAMELNSWQLLRLLQARLPDSLCIASICNEETQDESLEREMGAERSDTKLCFLFRKAAALHNSLKQQQGSIGRGYQNKDVNSSQSTMEAYIEFVRTASEWLARGTTEKPLHLVAMGGFLMCGSLVALLWVCFQVCKTIAEMSECHALGDKNTIDIIQLDKIIALAGICIHAVSLGASSMVEEEQYTWHFLLSTLCFSFLHRTCQLWSYLPGKKSKLFFWPEDLLKARENFSIQSARRKLNNPECFSKLSCECRAATHPQQVNLLLLQQPINAVPVVLLLLQLLAVTSYFYISGAHHKQWIMVVTMHWLGMSGHFGLGNSNTLATVDVAGAYIGLSTHSTILSGILAFIITYASPLLFLLALLLCSSVNEESSMYTSQEEQNLGYFFLKMIALPCVLPLALNSVVLVGFTAILLLMKNHLFVWSVFSPKYLYVCATTVCIYMGTSLIAISGIYSSFVILLRSRLHRL